MRRFIAAVCLSVVGSPFALLAAERPIDAANSSITIHLGKSGLFSAAAHEHQVSAPIEEGGIDDFAPGPRLVYRASVTSYGFAGSGPGEGAKHHAI